MKRALAFLLLTCVLFTMGACTSENENTEENTEENETKESESLGPEEPLESDSQKSTEKTGAKWEI